MAGIFGNHPFDRHRENELNRYLDSIDPLLTYCGNCGEEYECSDENYNSDEDAYTCPNCGELDFC